jgi:hypothetical protein
MILRLLKGRGMVSGLFEKKRDVTPPHPATPQALVLRRTSSSKSCKFVTRFCILCFFPGDVNIGKPFCRTDDTLASLQIRDTVCTLPVPQA